MSGYICDCDAWEANDDIVQANLVVEPQHNSGRLFFIKLTLEITNTNNADHSLNTIRTVKELFVPADESRGLTREAWDLISDGLNEMGAPRMASGETILQLTCCALKMVRDPANKGRSSLPIEALVTCVEDEEEEVEERRVDCGKTEEVVVGEAEMCPVCLVEMEVGSVASRLPCKHEFHMNCAREWFTYNRSCPICRRSID